MTKSCKACLAEKPVDGFYAQKSGDGRMSKCKECTKSAVRENRARKIDYYRAYDRHRHYVGGPRGTPSKEASARARAAWRDRNSHKRRAQNVVNNAIRDLRIAKPKDCERCGEAPTTHNLQAHHHDYTKPLDVVWLCTKCHGLEHRAPGWESLLEKPVMAAE